MITFCAHNNGGKQDGERAPRQRRTSRPEPNKRTALPAGEARPPWINLIARHSFPITEIHFRPCSLLPCHYSLSWAKRPSSSFARLCSHPPALLSRASKSTNKSELLSLPYFMCDGPRTFSDLTSQGASVIFSFCPESGSGLSSHSIKLTSLTEDAANGRVILAFTALPALS